MITLSSDFGSPYPAAMRGVILQTSDARLVDVSHSFPRQDVRTAAFWLREILPYFPPATHLVVVDPGVGTDRDAIVLRAGEHTLVGPDNGVLAPAARRLGASSGASSADLDSFRIVTRPSATVEDPIGAWPPVRSSATFHGRDVFAPAAARVHDRTASLETDPGLDSVETIVELSFSEPTVGDGTAVGEVLVVDGFGNVITNVPGGSVDPDTKTVLVDGAPVPFAASYAAVSPGERLVTVGSHGYVELAANRGRGDDAFDISPGETIQLEWSGK